MNEKYFFVTGGKRKGPVTFAELRELALKGELRRADKAWRKGMAAWDSAGSISGLFDDLPPDLEEECPLLGTPVSLPQEPDGSELKSQASMQLMPEMALSSIRTKLTPSAQRKLLIVGVGFTLVTLALLWPSPDNKESIRNWNISHNPMPSSGPQSSAGYGIGETPGFSTPTLSQKAELRRAAQAAGISEQEMERMRVQGEHVAGHPEDGPDGVNAYQRDREASRRASGWYEQKRP